MSQEQIIPTVAVVIPVYCRSDEHEQYLTEALQSVAAQTFRDFEVIIVDDVSPRDVRPILTKVDGLPHVRYIRNEANVGHANSRNIGVKSTKAEFVAFLDHDDLWKPEKLERQVQELKKQTDAGMVFCAVEVFGSHARRLGIDQSIIPDKPSFYWLINHGNYVITATTAMVRRDVLVEIGLFDPRYSTCDDFDAWLKIVRKRPILYLPEPLAKYRLHSLNTNYGVDRLNDNRLLTSLLIDYWRSAPLKEKMLLLPRIGRKLLGRAYFHLFRYRRFND